MENVVESQVQVFEPQSPIESSSDYGPVIKDSVMNVYNVEGNVSQEMATELIKSQNIKTSLDLEAARHATLQDEVKNSELKKAETEKALELEKVRKENLKEERTVHELQLKTEKIEREKADVERNTRHQTEEKEKQLVKEAEIKVLRDRVKNEVTDLRVFEQRELKIQSLDCVDGDGLGAFHISEMIEKKKVWAGMPITVSDGSTVTIASLILKHTSLQMADLIEPMNSNSIATLTIKDNFKISISTPLRGGEEYVVFFGSKDIISIINSDGENPTLVKSLIEYLSEPSFFNENTLKRVEEALKLQGRLRENINFSERVYARIEEKLLAELDNQVNTTMKDYSFVVKDGKTTFMGKKGANVIPYTEKALLQTLRGKKIVMVHPITRKETTYYPAELWVKNEMYKIYDGTVYYPSDSYEGVEYNINCGHKYQADDSLDITPFIDFMLQEGCSNDENMSNTVWGFYAEKLQNPLVKNATALALVSDEDAVKDLLLKPFRMVFEYNYFIATDKKQIFGVNIDLENKLLVEIDDSLIAKQDIIKLDSLIKNSNFSYQEKAGKILTKANYSSCVITCANHEFVSSMAKKKMLIVPRVSSAKADDMYYLDSIQKLIDNVAFAPALMYYLLNFPYQDYKQNLKHPPVTKLSNEEIEEGFSTEVKWLYEHLKAGEFTSIGAELVSEGGIRVSSTGSFRNFETFSKSIGEKTTLKVHTFGTKMSNIFSSSNLKKAGQKLSNHTFGDEINAVDYGPLSKCRKAFESYTGLNNPNWIGDVWQVS